MNYDVRIKLKVLSKGNSNDIDFFFNRFSTTSIRKDVQNILEEIKKGGINVVRKYIERFDGVKIRRLEVTRKEVNLAVAQVDPLFKKTVREVFRRVSSFARSGLRKNWYVKSRDGVMLGERFVPLKRVGIYIPAGVSPLVSTVLMTVPIARVAGVEEIVVCTPPTSNGSVNPYVLYTASYCGATEIYKAGGIVAIALMGYGIAPCKKVDKIVGPGGIYTAEAKRQMYGEVGIDMVAGPSEIAIIADSSANPRWVASDLLSQAEHGTGFERVFLVTTSYSLAVRCIDEIKKQYIKLPARDKIQQVLEKGTLIVVADSMDQAVMLCNKFAPEHLEVMVRNPDRIIDRVRCAGAIFIGGYTPESVGDYVAGPSHVLPTGGAAVFSSGLTVEDFRRRISIIKYTREELAKSLFMIRQLGKVESMFAHIKSAEVRFE